MSLELPERIVELKAITGIAKADCVSCEHAHADWDDDFAEHYCGTRCEK